MGFMNEFFKAYNKSTASASKMYQTSKAAQLEEEAMMFRKEQELKREIIFAKADGSAYEGGNPHEKKTVEQIIQHYNEFDVNYAKGCVKTVADMMVNAFKDHPSDYSMFEKLCTKQAAAKIKRITSTKRINWYDFSVGGIDIIRYTPDDVMPTVVMKLAMSFKPEEQYPGFTRFTFFYSCLEGAKTCSNCGGIIENQLVDLCPYCDQILTDSSTEKAWKITDVRQVT